MFMLTFRIRLIIASFQTQPYDIADVRTRALRTIEQSGDLPEKRTHSSVFVLSRTQSSTLHPICYWCIAESTAMIMINHCYTDMDIYPRPIYYIAAETMFTDPQRGPLS